MKQFIFGKDKDCVYSYPDKQKKFFKYRHNLLKQTISEKLFEEILIELQVKYCKQKGFLVNAKTFCIVDFYISKPYRLAIEIDGKYHEEQQLYDKQREAYLLSRRIKTIRFTNEEVLNKQHILDILYKHI